MKPDPKWECKKVARVGYKQKGEGWLAYIKKSDKPGIGVIIEQKINFSKPPRPKEVASFPFEYDKRHSDYIDADGDVSQCNPKHIQKVKKAGWISAKS